MKDYFWDVVLMLVAAAVGIAIALLMGCDGIAVNHDVNLKIDGVNVCKESFPICTAGGPACVNTEGELSATCSVSCLGARELVCGPDAGIPDCFQLVGDVEDPTLVHVPVYCLEEEP